MRLTSPSARFPGRPPVSIDVPDTWSPDDIAGAVLTAYDTASPDHFRVNVAIAIDRVAGGPASPSLVQIAARFADSAVDELPSFVVHGEEVVDTAGIPRFLRLHSYRPDGVPFPVFQAQCLVLVAAGDPSHGPQVADLVQLHATCPGDVADRYGAVFRAIADSLEIGRAPAITT